MRLYAIGDLHLPSTRGKSMDRFGWLEHPRRLERAWDAMVRADDAVILAGDLSWGTRPSEVLEDLRWMDERPGRKVLLRGNHDYWWGDSTAKLKRLFGPFASFAGFLHNSAVRVGPYVIAGSRLWTTPEAPPLPGGELGDVPAQPDYVEREVRRLRLSIEAARGLEAAAATPTVRVAAVHFPPLYANGLETAFSRELEAWSPRVCVYGHLHGPGIPAGYVGVHGAVRYVLASCDAAEFAPVLLCDEETAEQVAAP